MPEWPVVRLGDVTDLLTGYPFASAHYSYHPEDPRLLRGDNLIQGAIRWDGVKRWPADATGGLEHYGLQIEDVVVAMDRPWIEAGLKHASIREPDLPALLVQRVARLRGRHDLSTRFLACIVGSRAFTDYVLSVQTGTTVPHISGPQLREFRFRLPPVPDQLAIATILSALDDKSELNREHRGDSP